MGCEAGPQAGNCDSGYSCAYSANVSWRSESTPNAKEINPRLVFERLFGDGSAESAASQAQRAADRKSILDFVLEDARDLDRRWAPKTAASWKNTWCPCGKWKPESPAASAGSGNRPGPDQARRYSGDYGQHIRLMADLMVLAFQSDQTRVATFVLANEGSNRSYAFIDVPEGHHDLSHHGRNPDKQRKIREINRFHMTQFAYLLGKAAKRGGEGERTLLENSLILYGSGISDGDRHNHDDLPIVLAGGGGGTVRTGRHVRDDRETPISNLYLAMLQRQGVRTEKLGDSDGVLDLG